MVDLSKKTAKKIVFYMYMGILAVFLKGTEDELLLSACDEFKPLNLRLLDAW